ncbi:MAG: hypothetical protein NT069_11205 [Planctomycetota bacterium]|nr:hypothetical protein [Planctomycetota bacterium]
MSSTSPRTYRAVPHAAAVITALLALLPIALGAQTTTKAAGMAFPDWPTSDGHGMLSYPWFAATGAKFLEHGHRLAGVLIGVSSIVLAATLWIRDRRSWVCLMGNGVVFAVIVQGILGGQRVLLDARGLAFIHGSTAALVFSYMWGVAVVTSRGWFTSHSSEGSSSPSTALSWLSIATYVAVYVQYVLGGLVRHQGQALVEHLVFAFVAALAILILAVSAASTGQKWLLFPSLASGVLMLVQLVLGAGTWVTKYGFGDAGNPVYGSTEQIAFRTSHVLNGMLLFASVSVLVFRIQRLRWLATATGRNMSGRVSERAFPLSAGIATPGGTRCRVWQPRQRLRSPHRPRSLWVKCLWVRRRSPKFP